jgi:RNA polymerase sigma-70 factor (ECF subfamily)
LAALAAHLAARQAARRDAAGAYVPLDAQDMCLWDGALQAEAEGLLHRARATGPVGRFQIEAAIQSAHCQRLFTGQTPWRAIVHLYGVLARLAPTTGSTIAEAVARVEIGDSEGAALLLDALAPERVAAHAPYWLARAHLAERALDEAGRAHALTRAIELTSDESVRAHLQDRLALREAARR